jgi:hypothetical protein
MGEERNMKEQMASHTYKRQSPLPQKRKGEREHRLVSEKASQTGRRVVTIPQTDPSAAWNTFFERRKQLHRELAKPPKYTAVVQRSHAQIARRTADRPLGTFQRLPPVPDRSGRRTTRRPFQWRLLSFLSVAVALLVAASFAISSNAFRIEQVNVIGTHNPVLTDAIQRMGMQGQNIFLLDVEALTERIEASPLVATASLSKQWPNQLTVTVVERKPVLLWQTAKETYSVDIQGIVIALASETINAAQLNTVIATGNQQPGQQGNAGYSIHPGSHLNQADISFAMKVFASLPQLTGITAFQLRYDGTMYTSSVDGSAAPGGSGSFIVESPAGWIAYLGRVSDINPLENRLIELQQILAIMQKQQLPLATVDLRYGLRPVYTLKQ